MILCETLRKLEGVDFMRYKNTDALPIKEEAKWKKVSDKYPRYACTACNHLYNNKEYKYCPNCGAKMERSNENAE